MTYVASPQSFVAPEWAIDPSNDLYKTRCATLRIAAIENGCEVQSIRFRPEFPYLIFGKDAGIVHEFVGHHSLSPQHAALVVHRELGYVMILNLESSTGVKLRSSQGFSSVNVDEPREVLPNDEFYLGKAPRSFRLMLV